MTKRLLCRQTGCGGEVWSSDRNREVGAKITPDRKSLPKDAARFSVPYHAQSCLPPSPARAHHLVNSGGGADDAQRRMGESAGDTSAAHRSHGVDRVGVRAAGDDSASPGVRSVANGRGATSGGATSGRCARHLAARSAARRGSPWATAARRRGGRGRGRRQVVQSAYPCSWRSPGRLCRVLVVHNHNRHWLCRTVAARPKSCASTAHVTQAAHATTTANMSRRGECVAGPAAWRSRLAGATDNADHRPPMPRAPSSNASKGHEGRADACNTDSAPPEIKIRLKNHSSMRKHCFTTCSCCLRAKL